MDKHHHPSSYRYRSCGTVAHKDHYSNTAITATATAKTKATATTALAMATTTTGKYDKKRKGRRRTYDCSSSKEKKTG